jgi:hypothetical protein
LLSPYYGSFTNQADGTVNLVESGHFWASISTTNANHGMITIEKANASMHFQGPLTNTGRIENRVGSFLAISLTNTSTGVLYNDVYATWTCGDSDWSKLDNEGVFTNRYILNINHKCVFTNKVGATLENQGNTYIGETSGYAPSGTLLNQGSVSNTGKIILVGIWRRIQGYDCTTTTVV